MASRISQTTFDCENAYALSAWWKLVLDYRDVPGDENVPGHPECMIVDPVAHHRILFVEVPDDKRVKNRVHFDLVPTDRRRDEEIERLRALGARDVADLRKSDGGGWMVLADPEGNEFCVLRSADERDGGTS